MKKWIVLGLVTVALIAPYFACDGERTALNDQTRALAPGKFIQLSQGATHYQLGGPAQGQVLVLIHGYSLPLFLWDYVFPDLTSAGYRVLRYDLYGRGFSDRPRTDYNPQLFDTQLLELIEALKLKPPVNLAGVSMGGAVSVHFTARHPEVVKKVILISPYGFPQKLGLGADLMKVPVIGDYLMAVIGDRVFMGRLPDNFHQPLDMEMIRTRFTEQLRIKGYKRALLSTMRNFMSQDFTGSFETLGRHRTPTLLIWGQRDKVVPFAFHRKVKQAIPQVEFQPLENRGHAPMLEKPKIISDLMINFLKE